MKMNENSEVSTPKKKKNMKVYDTHGQIYELTEEIGHGGQGQVFTTKLPNVLVKVMKTSSEESQRKWVDQIRWIMRQPLDGLEVARPVALIDKPMPGYVMELMDGLESLSLIMERAEMSLLEGNGLKGYLFSGGIMRRVNILARLARLLSELHSRGIAYGDLSPGNVFISTDLDHFETWLIDCDNLCVNSRMSTHRVYTPDYGAPEILSNMSGINTLTDSWSFGVLAFKLMMLTHPFKGDMVNEGTPDAEEQALKGLLPWIDSQEDSKNALSRGIGLPRDTVLTNRLKSLFQQCFEQGRDDAGARPSMSAWAEGFEAAAMLCVRCEAEDCRSSFFAEVNLVCPFCDHRQQSKDHLKMSHFLLAPEFAHLEGAKETDIWIRTDNYVVLWF